MVLKQCQKHFWFLFMARTFSRVFSLWLSCGRTGVSTQTEMCFWAVRHPSWERRRDADARHLWLNGVVGCHGCAATFSFSALYHSVCCSKLLRLCDCSVYCLRAWAALLHEFSEGFFSTLLGVLAGKKDQRCLFPALIFFYKPPWNLWFIISVVRGVLRGLGNNQLWIFHAKGNKYKVGMQK